MDQSSNFCSRAQRAIQRRSLDEIAEEQVRRGQIWRRSLDEVCGLNPAGSGSGSRGDRLGWLKVVGAGPPVTNRFKPPGRPRTIIRRKNRLENQELVVKERKKSDLIYF